LVDFVESAVRLIPRLHQHHHGGQQLRHVFSHLFLLPLHAIETSFHVPPLPLVDFRLEHKLPHAVLQIPRSLVHNVTLRQQRFYGGQDFVVGFVGVLVLFSHDRREILQMLFFSFILASDDFLHVGLQVF